MHLPEAYDYKRLEKYPGMGARDVEIWERFIVEYPTAFDRVWYNVKLGNPAKSEDEEQEMRLTGLYDVSQWAIDVLGQKGNIYYTLEIKPNALAGALGQTLAYTALLKEEKYYGIFSTPIVLTDDIATITEEAARLLRVIMYSV